MRKFEKRILHQKKKKNKKKKTKGNTNKKKKTHKIFENKINK